MNKIITVGLLSLLFSLPALGQDKAAWTPVEAAKGLQVDIRAKGETWFLEEMHLSVTSSVGYRFNDKRYLGLEFGLASGQFHVDEGLVVHSHQMLKYYGAPLYLDYIRYFKPVRMPLVDCSVRGLVGACAGAMIQYYPKTDYTYYGFDGKEDGTGEHYEEQRNLSSLSCFPYALVKAGLEFQAKSRSRFSLGVEWIPFSLGGGIFLSYGF